MINGGSNRAQRAVESPTLSPEFLTGNTEAGLDKIRTRLLDLTNRNRLLNFQHTVASSLRIVDTALDSVFRRLLDGERLEFMPAPEPRAGFDSNRTSEAKALANPSAAEYATSLGWNTSYDLDSNSEEDETTLPVLHYMEGLETLTRKIGSAATTAIEESGTNMLYLILGFLEWYESEDSQQARIAPLVTIPVTLERSGPKGRGFECTIEYSGEDLTTNLSLVEKMRRDFGLEIPAIEDDDIPEKYFVGLGPLLNQKPRWRVRRQITLSLLSFGKLLMYRDLDTKAWPGIAAHALVKELFEGRKSETITQAAEYLIDSPKIAPDVPALILDADSSQHSALIDALKGRNLVIEGPPGTGKSQTITNLIAAALVSGKTVLFVAEKLTALEVVRRRLDEAGLGLFCLELHSHKTKKHALLNDLSERLKAQGSFRDPRDLDQQRATVEDRKKLLLEYATLVNKSIEPAQRTIFEVLWARDRYYQELPFSPQLVEQVLLPPILNFTRGQFADAVHFLSTFGIHLGAIQQLASKTGEHPWSWIERDLNFHEEIQILDAVARLSSNLRLAIGLRQALAQNTGTVLEDHIDGMRNAQELARRLPGANVTVIRELLQPCSDHGMSARLRSFIKEVEDAQTLEADLHTAIESEY